MSDEQRQESHQLQSFLDAFDGSSHERVSLSIRYIAGKVGDDLEIWAAEVAFLPDPLPESRRFTLDMPAFQAGEVIRNALDRADALQVALAAVRGALQVDALRLRLPGSAEPMLQSRYIDIERGVASPDLNIIGGHPALDPYAIARFGSLLRAASPPFDGLDDLAAWLDLPTPRAGLQSSITLYVRPSIGLIDEGCALTAGQLTVSVRAHCAADCGNVRLGIRAKPTTGPTQRLQIADCLTWREEQGQMIGTATVAVASANRALVLLSVGNTLVRRRWLEDSTRSDNPRLTSVRVFDRELKMLRRAIAGSDSDKFELAVASILYLHGLAPMVQLETDAPDIVAQTHRGRTLLVECTLKAKDATTKVGKLVDRRAQLARAEESSGSGLDIVAVLVTGQTREQAQWLSDVCIKQGIILLTAEDLQDDIDAAQGPPDAERWVERLTRRVSSASGDAPR